MAVVVVAAVVAVLAASQVESLVLTISFALIQRTRHDRFVGDLRQEDPGRIAVDAQGTGCRIVEPGMRTRRLEDAASLSALLDAPSRDEDQ